MIFLITVIAKMLGNVKSYNFRVNANLHTLTSDMNGEIHAAIATVTDQALFVRIINVSITTL